MTGADLKAIRLSLGMSQDAFAKELGVSRVHVWRMESPPDTPNHRNVTRSIEILAKRLAES